MYGGEERLIHGFGERPMGKISLGRPRCGWGDNIKMDLQEVGGGCEDLMELAQDRDKVAGTCECGNEPSGTIQCGEFLDYLRTG